jgi:EAL domain-containing protein (putative c-di-GMP-specific phosphodiesterase class I)
MEALLRWDHPDKGVIEPERFIAVAEESGLIHEIGEWVLHEACLQARKWLEQGLSVPGLAINVSAREVLHDHLGERIARALERSGLDPAELMIELEITESVLQRSEFTLAILKALRSLGVHIAIDDFGTGYSSLAQLKQLPLDALKVDRSFLRDLSVDADSRAIVRAILAMGQSLQLKVVAEGVESPEQLEFLRHYACDVVQGYFLGEPLSAEAMGELLSRH